MEEENEFSEVTGRDVDRAPEVQPWVPRTVEKGGGGGRGLGTCRTGESRHANLRATGVQPATPSLSTTGTPTLVSSLDSMLSPGQGTVTPTPGFPRSRLPCRLFIGPPPLPTSDPSRVDTFPGYHPHTEHATPGVSPGYSGLTSPTPPPPKTCVLLGRQASRSVLRPPNHLHRPHPTPLRRPDPPTRSGAYRLVPVRVLPARGARPVPDLRRFPCRAVPGETGMIGRCTFVGPRSRTVTTLLQGLWWDVTTPLLPLGTVAYVPTRVLHHGTPVVP